ncbi:hypothetical protein ACO0QE_004304 [Hanseniaspora vineae]
MSEKKSSGSMFKARSLSSRANFKKLTLNNSGKSSNVPATSSVRTSSLNDNSDYDANTNYDASTNYSTSNNTGSSSRLPLPTKKSYTSSVSSSSSSFSSTSSSSGHVNPPKPLANISSSSSFILLSLNRLNKPKLNLFGNNKSASNDSNNSSIKLNVTSPLNSRKSISPLKHKQDYIAECSSVTPTENSHFSNSSSPSSLISSYAHHNDREETTINPPILDSFNQLNLSPSKKSAMEKHLSQNENISLRNTIKNQNDPEIQLEDIVQIGKIGSGNSGTVLKVLHVPTQRIVAKKTIPLNSIFSSTDNNNKDIMLQVKKQIVRELTIMQKIGKHDNIVEFYSAFYNTITNKHTKLVTPLSTLTIELNNNSNTGSLSKRNIGTFEGQDRGFGITKQHIEIEQVCETDLNGKSMDSKERNQSDDDDDDDDDKRITNEIIILMEYMNCGSLDRIISTYKKHCKRCGVAVCPETSWFNNENYISKISYGVLNGLYFLYQNFKIIHRDIKPSNILINSKGFVKICDFGVSKKLVNSIADTFVGTSTYMSPERIQGGIYTTKGDVWSLGLMIIELLSGRFPLSSNKFKTSKPKITSKRYDGDLIIEEEEEEEEEEGEYPKGGSSALEEDMDDTPDGILDLLQRIVNEPSPTLPDYNNMYSADLRDFVNKCCIKAEAERASLKELLQHPLILTYNFNKDTELQQKYDHEFKRWCKNIKKLAHEEKLMQRQEQMQALNFGLS